MENKKLYLPYQINGITTDECLEKLKVMFKEIDLYWNLEQLEKVKSGEQILIV